MVLSKDVQLDERGEWTEPYAYIMPRRIHGVVGNTENLIGNMEHGTWFFANTKLQQTIGQYNALYRDLFNINVG